MSECGEARYTRPGHSTAGKREWFYLPFAFEFSDRYRLVGFSFMIPPLLEKLPSDPLPNPVEDPLFYGEIWLKYTGSKSLSPLHFGHLFKAKCEFRIIMQRFCSRAFAKGVEVELDQAYQLYSQLKYWYNHLPEPLQPRNIVLPAHLQLQ